jgi:hypothetical protein
LLSSDFRNLRSFAKNNYTVPDDFVDEPEKVQDIIKVKNMMKNLLEGKKP